MAWNQGTVLVNNLRVRTAPSLTAKTLTYLKKGTDVMWQNDCPAPYGIADPNYSCASGTKGTATSPSPYRDSAGRIWWKLKRGGWSAAKSSTKQYMAAVLSAPQPAGKVAPTFPVPSGPAGQTTPKPTKPPQFPTFTPVVTKEDKTGTAVAILGISVVLIGALTLYLVKEK
jgi:hypothetical protein